MLVSANDVYRMAHRAADGAGAPPGLELDAARATEWLALAGLPGVAALVADLDAGRATADACRVLAETAAGLRFANASGLLVGAMAIEWCAAQQAGRRRIEGLVSALGLLPAAAERAAECGGIAVAAGDKAACFLASGDATLLGEWPELAPEAEEVVVATGSAAQDLFDAIAGHRGSGKHSPAAERIRHLQNGMEIDGDVWRRLLAHAAHILVPPSAVSRTRGAGSGKIDDND